MKKQGKVLDELAKLAKIRSDLEMKRFAAFRAHFDVLEEQKSQNKTLLAAAFKRKTAFSIAEARLANLEAGLITRDILRLETELKRIRPGVDNARKRAVWEFSRVQALKKLAEKARTEGGK